MTNPSYLSEIHLPGRGISRTLQCRAIQSPLAGVGDQIFRELVRRWAPEALLFTEMVNASSLELGYGIKKVEEISQEEGPIGIQLFDYRPEAMAEAAKKAEAAGAFLIDINMGCPVKKIARKGGGSGLLKEPELAREIVTKVANSINIPLTVKTRLGWCERSCTPVEFALQLEEAGAQLITLHGRTRKQGFSGKADWEAIRKVKEALKIPLIANGDITSAAEAMRCLSITKADGVMIGRASLGAPWLVGQIDMVLKGLPPIETPGAKDRIILVLDQLQSLLESNGEHGLLIARKHMNWTLQGFSGSSKLRHSLLRTQKPSEAINLLEKQLMNMA